MSRQALQVTREERDNGDQVMAFQAVVFRFQDRPQRAVRVSRSEMHKCEREPTRLATTPLPIRAPFLPATTHPLDPGNVALDGSP